MDLGTNSSKESDLSGSPGSSKSHRSSRSCSESDVSPRERRKQKYIVKDEGTDGLRVGETKRTQRGLGFEGLCLGPGAYDNLTFKDDNGQIELNKRLGKDEPARMNSRTKVLHKSYERLTAKGGISSEHNGINGNNSLYEKARPQQNKPPSLNSSPNKTSSATKGTKNSPSLTSKTRATSSESERPIVNGDTENHSALPTSPGGIVPDTPRTIQIPPDGNLQAFSPDDMTIFFRCMKVDELIIQRLKRKKIDGKKFSRLKDVDLEEMGIKNPIMCYFRDRSKRQRMGFML